MCAWFSRDIGEDDVGVSGRKKATGALKIGRSIDTERNSVNDGDIYPHSRFEGAQLFELLALLQR
jgi:hypothetical protein